MANVVYPKFKEAILDDDNLIDFSSDTLKVVLVTSSYVYSAAHDFLDDIGATTVGTAQTLTSKTTTNGVFDADDAVFTALSGSAVAGAVIYKDTGVSSTSRLIAFFDTITGFPFTPSGATYTLQWDSGANKIFAL